MAIIGKDRKYKWNFENIGGTTRVRITTGEDIAHLEELDPKMWTVLSCPVKGLEIDEKSLAFMDCDQDGRIRVSDVICTSKWLVSVLNNPDHILAGKDCIDITDLNRENECGARLYQSAEHILNALGREGTVITLSDIADMSAVYANTLYNGDGVITEKSADSEEDKAAICAAVAATGGVQDRSGIQGVNAAQIEAFYKDLSDYAAWCDARVEAPFGDRTDAVIEAYNALDAKVKDFFMRSKLAAFSPESVSALDVQTARIEAISADNLDLKTDEIASYPIVRVTGRPELDLTAAVNPAWADKFALVKSEALSSRKKTMTQEDWDGIRDKFAPYVAWKASKAGSSVESLGLETVKSLLAQDRKAALLDLTVQDASVSEQVSYVDLLDKFLHVYRDFYRLLRNFVTFHDFYDKNRKVKAIFQAGTLLVDQRECRFCMSVNDLAKHSGAAAASGMFLVYCDCTASNRPGKQTIAAAVTVGEIGDLVVGKNAVYYDNEGQEWDAVITKVVENPISISQAFWSPYRRMSTAVENLINKSAADKDAKLIKEATEKINAVPATVPAADGKTATPAPPFDIAKFAGIFAAIGMAFGMIGTALSGLVDSLSGLGWKLILVFLGIILVISGPAMIMAWLKLRRRNISPLLNANGWAINAASKISIPFGETLTDIAKYPKIKLADPYARKGLAPWKKVVVTLSLVVALAGGLWLGNLLSWAGLDSPLPRFNEPEPVEEILEEALR